MKESNITSEVVKLSKEITKLWKMDIVRGVWCADDSGGIHLARGNYSNRLFVPIPSISDCLEKLDKLGWVVWLGNADDSEVKAKWVCHVYQIDEMSEQNYGDNPLEALLSAFLKVLRG